MAVKNCCIDDCNSCSSREEDVGVTYHKFPKDTTLRDIWVDVTHHKLNTELLEYVCSRHFCKSDFQTYKDSKYILKSDAVPSIFSWTMSDITTENIVTKTDNTDIKPEKMDEGTEMPTENVTEVLNDSKESEAENVDAIKKFIEDHDNELNTKTDTKELIIETVSKENSPKPVESTNEPSDIVKDYNKDAKTEESKVTLKENCEEASADSVIDIILSESEAKIAEKKDGKSMAKRDVGEKGNNSMALSVGSKVEAKDFADFWHPAEISEVDYDEMEVLVHYDDALKRHDEWISVSSPRLRPVGSSTEPSSQTIESLPSTSSAPIEPITISAIKEEKDVKTEDKPKMTFAVAERCLARWRDNRRFIATVSQDLGDGKYEIMFDDAVKWTCNMTRLSKLKESSKKDSLTIDTTGLPPSSSTPSPVYGPGPSNAGIVQPIIAPVPSLNTHLFDPTRDYLGSKSERREMKRKLNIKEIFNIGQKKRKIDVPQNSKTEKKVVTKKAKVVRKKAKVEPSNTSKVKDEIPANDLEISQNLLKSESNSQSKDAVASIIGTTTKEPVVEIQSEVKDDGDVKLEIVDPENAKMDLDDCFDTTNSETLSAPESQDIIKQDEDVVIEEEVKLEKFEKDDDVKHEKVIDRIKEVITKLEDGLNQTEIKTEILEPKELTENIETKPVVSEPQKEKIKTKIKKVKKVRLLHEKKVKKQVEKVKNELEIMKKQMEEMRRQMSEELAKKEVQEMPESFLLPGEWCCKWVNGQPVGTVSEIEQGSKLDTHSNKPALPRRSVQVEDKRLPPGWTKHMVRRSFGNSAGKWDVVLMSPDNRRLHTKTDMRIYLENNPDEALKAYEYALMDFGIHLKLSRRMGWYITTPDGKPTAPSIPVGMTCTTSPLVKRKQLSLKRERKNKDRKKLRFKMKSRSGYRYEHFTRNESAAGTSGEMFLDESEIKTETSEQPPLEDGCVYVGSLKVQIIENLLRCPAEGCFKNFRNNTLLKMHIKHYHRELKKMLGATPKVLDLAYARTRPTEKEMRRLKLEAAHRTIKVKLPKLPRKLTEPKPDIKDQMIEPKIETLSPVTEGQKIPRSLDSPKLRVALTNKPVKRPKVLLPVRRPDQEMEIKEEDIKIEPKIEVPEIEPLDFETAISTHTVTKPFDGKRKGEKKKKFASICKKITSEDEEWLGMNSDVETRSSYPRSGTPDSKLDQKLVSSESNEEQKEANYMFTETGERIKIVHMKREEIINCHCGFREEDGLMVQCELCLCWQHALCHNIQKESEVPEKYTCSICLNPRRGRRSQRFLHDQDRLYEGLLPGAKPCESLRRSHELSGNLHRIEDALHALRVKYYVATKKDHPKLYLWAKDWEATELSMTQEKLNSDYSDLNIMISNIGKENLPLRPDDKDMGLGMRTPPAEDPEVDRYSQRDSQLGSQALLSGLLASPGGASLDLPISTTELERLAKSVQAEAEVGCVSAPQPEAAIENSACRERLLRHIQRCQALVDARLDSIEAQVAELESQDPSFEDDETADFFPRTKQTIQMLMRDLDNMEELGVIT